MLLTVMKQGRRLILVKILHQWIRSAPQASPATVSRCGMIYMEPSTLGWRPLVASYINSIPKDWPGDYIQSMFEWLTDSCLTFVRKQCVQLVTGGESNCMMTVIHLVDAILKVLSISFSWENRYLKVVSGLYGRPPWNHRLLPCPMIQ